MILSRKSAVLLLAVSFQCALGEMPATEQQHLIQREAEGDGAIEELQTESSASPVPQSQHIAKASRFEYMKALKYAELQTLHSAVQYETRINFHKKQVVSALLKELAALETQIEVAGKVQEPLVKARLHKRLKDVKDEMSHREAHIERLQSQIRSLQELHDEKLAEFDAHEKVRLQQNAEIVHMSALLHATAAKLKAAQAEAAHPILKDSDAADMHSSYLQHLKHVLKLKKALEAKEQAVDDTDSADIAALKKKLVGLNSADDGPNQTALKEQLSTVQAEIGHLSFGMKELHQEGETSDAEIKRLEQSIVAGTKNQEAKELLALVKGLDSRDEDKAGFQAPDVLLQLEASPSEYPSLAETKILLGLVQPKPREAPKTVKAAAGKTGSAADVTADVAVKTTMPMVPKVAKAAKDLAKKAAKTAKVVADKVANMATSAQKKATTTAKTVVDKAVPEAAKAVKATAAKPNKKGEKMVAGVAKTVKHKTAHKLTKAVEGKGKKGAEDVVSEKVKDTSITTDKGTKDSKLKLEPGVKLPLGVNTELPIQKEQPKTVWQALSCMGGDGSPECGLDMFGGTPLVLYGVVVMLCGLTFKQPSDSTRLPQCPFGWSLMTVIYCLIILGGSSYLLYEDTGTLNHGDNLEALHLICADIYFLVPYLALLIIAAKDFGFAPLFRVVEWQVVSLLYVIPRTVLCIMQLIGDHEPGHVQGTERPTLTAVRLTVLAALSCAALTALRILCSGMTLEGCRGDLSRAAAGKTALLPAGEHVNKGCSETCDQVDTAVANSPLACERPAKRSDTKTDASGRPIRRSASEPEHEPVCGDFEARAYPAHARPTKKGNAFNCCSSGKDSAEQV